MGAVFSVSLAICVAGLCASAAAERPPVESAGPSAPFAAAGGFSVGEFRFVPTVPDDGQGPAGGWQEATAKLRIVDLRHLVPRIWSCLMTVGMPLRTASEGRIPAEEAALRAATVATQASSAVMHRQAEWIPAVYCKRFGDEMLLLFQGRYPRLGARVRGQ